MKNKAFKNLRKKSNAETSIASDISLAAIEQFIHGNIEKAYEIIQQPVSIDPRKISAFQNPPQRRENVAWGLSTEGLDAHQQNDFNSASTNANEQRTLSSRTSQNIDAGSAQSNSPYSNCKDYSQDANEPFQPLDQSIKTEEASKDLKARCINYLREGQHENFEATYALIKVQEVERQEFAESEAVKCLNEGLNQEARRIYEYLLTL